MTDQYRIFSLKKKTFFAGGVKFDTLDDVRKQLISFHEETELKDKTLAEIINLFQWEIKTERGETVLIDKLNF